MFFKSTELTKTDVSALSTAAKQDLLQAEVEAIETRLSESLTVNGDLTIAEPLTTRPDTGVIDQGSVAVVSAGTAVQMPAKALKNSVLLMGHPDNAGRIYYGSSTVGNALSGPYLDEFIPGVSLELANLSELYVNADTSGDRVLWVAH